jgi:hypothetical protein
VTNKAVGGVFLMEHRAYGQVPDPAPAPADQRCLVRVGIQILKVPQESAGGGPVPSGPRIPEPIHRPAGINRMTERLTPCCRRLSPHGGPCLERFRVAPSEQSLDFLVRYAYAPTAPFAMIELGLPASIVGAIVGLIVGSILAVGRRLSRNDH